jgi:superfamily II DNA or RNA helicase
MTEQRKVLMSELAFGPGERLKLQQLRILEWIYDQALQSRTKPDDSGEAEQDRLTDLSQPWELLRGIQLKAWQEECRDAWFRSGRKGTIKVVTGAGKTILALAIIQQLQNEQLRDLRVAVVVPTIVLMNQWHDQLLATSNLPPWAIGRLGGGYKDAFNDSRRILLAVLDSAQRELPQMVKGLDLGKRLLLIADECHRAGAPVMSRVLATERIASLGLSATPEREDDEDTGAEQGYDNSLLGRELGPLIYELTLAQALEMGIVPPYTIKHYGLELTESERAEYEQLSRSISDCRNELQNYAGPRAQSGASFFSWVQKTVRHQAGDLATLAGRFLQETSRRRALLYGAEARYKALERILKEQFETNADSMALLFHESIESVNDLYLRLYLAGFPVVLEHSQLPQELRNLSLELFRKGIAKVMVSAKSLIEGFNVPAVDTGIVVASTTSVRQRIQSLGRVLRRFRTASGEEKSPLVHIFYVRDTVDELIYEREDWSTLTGADRNVYYHLNLNGELVEQSGPPRKCLPRDEEIDESTLVPGSPYPGRLEGQVLSCDSAGNVRDAEGNLIMVPPEVPQLVKNVLGRPGRFYVTPVKYFCLARVPSGDQWETLFICKLPGKPVQSSPPAEAGAEELLTWLQTARPGQRYPFALHEPVQEYRYRQKRGGVITQKRERGEVFALLDHEASDRQKGEDARRVLDAIRETRKLGHEVTRLWVDSKGIAVYLHENQHFYLATLAKGFEFPV